MYIHYIVEHFPKFLILGIGIYLLGNLVVAIL